MFSCCWVPGPSTSVHGHSSSDTLLMVTVNDFFVLVAMHPYKAAKEQHRFLFRKLFACHDMSNSMFDVLFTHFLAGFFILFISSKTIVQSSVLPTPRTYTSDLDWQSKPIGLPKECHPGGHRS